MRNAILAVVVVVLSLPSMAFSQPATINSGVIAHGGSYVISGSGFGDRGDAAPFRYDNFESGDVGDRLASQGAGGWYTTTILPDYHPTYSVDRLRTAGTQSAFQNYQDGNYKSHIGLEGMEIETMYISGWFWAVTYNAPSRNFKLCSFYDQFPGSSFQGRHDMYPSNGSGHQILTDCDLTTQITNWDLGCPLNSNQQEWHRFEVWLDIGDVGGTNGIMTFKLDGEIVSESAGAVRTSACTFGVVTLANYFATDVGSPQPGMRWYWDELYIDDERARIEIGDAATWAASNHREIQVPQVWYDDQISFTANQGTFHQDQDAWVYVISADGSVLSPGIAVTFNDGNGEDPGPPGAPADVAMYELED